MADNITELKIGIGADLTQLDSDLKSAEKKIAGVGDTPVKIAVTPDIDAKAFIAKIQQAVAGQTVKVKVEPTTTDKVTGGNDSMAQTQLNVSRAQAAQAKQARAEERAALQEQANYQRAINQLRSMSMSTYQRQQERITEILQKQLSVTNRRIAAEQRSSGASKQAIAALQLEKSTLKTTAYTARLSVYAKDVAKQINRAKNSMAGMQGYARSTANIFKGIVLSQSFYLGVNAIRNMVADAWELSKALNTAEATFSGMLVGGQKQAQGLIEVLKQEAINTPFDIKNLLQATRLLTAYGIQAENLMYVMRAVEKATAASGDASKMENISRALGQIYTKGKLMGEEVRQLTEAGIAVSDILASELGLTQEELSKGWAALGLDANTAINAIIRGIDKRYGKALDNMAKTTEQKINNMRESFALIASSITDPVRRAIDSLIDTITPRLERMYQAIQAIGLGNALKTLLPPSVFDGAIVAINGVVRAAQAIGIVFRQIRPIVEAVMNALAWYGHILYNVFISVVSAIGMFGQAIGDSANGAALLEAGLKRVLAALLAYKAAMMVVAAVSKIWFVVSTVLKGVMLAIQGVIIATQAMAATMAAAGIAGAAGFLPIIGILLVIIGLVAALAGSLNSVIDASKRVGAALKNIGGGTNLGDMFKDMSSGLQDSIDAYNAEVLKQNEALSNALTEDENKQTDSAEDAAGATEKAMKGLMSFDEVYKLNEPAAAAGGAVMPVDIVEMPSLDFEGVFDGVGGLGDDLIDALDLSELQTALGDLWDEIYPILDEILLYGAKMLLYFKQMQLYSKLMTDESKEQWVLENQQTSEDKEQGLLEKAQTGEDREQGLLEKAQTSEDREQGLLEKTQTSQDREQNALEAQQTSQDREQNTLEAQQTSQDREQLLNEQMQTSQDREQLLNERLQTSQDKEQLLNEKLQTSQDQEQLRLEQLQTSQDQEQRLMTMTRVGGAGGVGTKGTAAALGLINIAQLAADAKLLSDDIKDLREDGATTSEWLALFVDGLMAAVDVLGLFMAGKILFGAGAKIAGGALAGGAAAAGGAALAGGAAAGGGVAAAASGALATVLPVIGTIVLVVAAIAAVVGGIYLAVKNWDKITAFFSKVWQAISTKISDIASSIGGWFSGIREKAGEIASSIGEWFAPIGAKVGEIAGKTGEWFSGAFETIKNGLLAVWENVLKPVWGVIAAALRVAWETVRLVFWAIAAGLKLAWEGIKKVIEAIGEALNKAWEWFKTKVIEPIGEALLKAWEWFKTKIIEPIGEALLKAWEWFKTKVIEPIGAALLAAWEAVKRIWDSIKTGLDAAWKAVDRVWTAVKTGLQNAWNNLDKVWTNVKNGLQSAWDAVNTVWGKITSGLNAVKDKINGVGDKIRSAANSLKDFVTGGNNNADGGIIRKHAKGAVFKRATDIGRDRVGEAGTEILFPLENTSFIKSFAEDIARAVGNVNMQQSARSINVQMEQARVGATQAMSISTASAKEISDAIRSWFTPQMQSLHDVLEQDRTLELTIPPTSNALWRMILSELKAVNTGSGARGFQLAN